MKYLFLRNTLYLICKFTYQLICFETLHFKCVNILRLLKCEKCVITGKMTKLQKCDKQKSNVKQDSWFCQDHYEFHKYLTLQVDVPKVHRQLLLVLLAYLPTICIIINWVNIILRSVWWLLKFVGNLRRYSDLCVSYLTYSCVIAENLSDYGHEWHTRRQCVLTSWIDVETLECVSTYLREYK